MNPDYEPWYVGIFGDYELPGETESLLFALQAAIGALIIGFFVGRYTKDRNTSAAKTEESEKQSEKYYYE